MSKSLLIIIVVYGPGVLDRLLDLICHKSTNLRHTSVVVLGSARCRIHDVVIEVDIAVVVVGASECLMFVLHLL